jgi:hypothetical protein
VEDKAVSHSFNVHGLDVLEFQVFGIEHESAVQYVSSLQIDAAGDENVR